MSPVPTQVRVTAVPSVTSAEGWIRSPAAGRGVAEGFQGKREIVPMDPSRYNSLLGFPESPSSPEPVGSVDFWGMTFPGNTAQANGAFPDLFPFFPSARFIQVTFSQDRTGPLFPLAGPCPTSSSQLGCPNPGLVSLELDFDVFFGLFWGS